MKCSLSSLIQALKTEFSLETCGNLDIQITDVQELTPDNPPLRPDVLYTIQQSQLLRYSGPAAQGPVLCIAHRSWELRHSQATFPTLIMVLCPEPGLVYAALSRQLYQEGARNSQMPEVSAAFLRCRSMDALVEQGYAFLENPFAVHDSDGKLLTFSRQAGARDDSWQSADFLDTLCDFHSVTNAVHMERSRQDQFPVLLHPEEGPEQMRMVLGSRGQTLGYLTIVAHFRPFTQADLQIAELLGCFITLDLLRQNSIARISVSDAGCLKSFLESGETNMPGIPQWLDRQRCGQDQQFYLLLFNNAPQLKVPFLDVDLVLAQLDEMFPEDICTRLEAGVVLLLKSDKPPGQSDAVQSMLSALSSMVTVGVSMPFRQLSESGHAALRQARSALELGCAIRPGESCYRYEDFAIYAGLRAASARMDLRELIPTGLMELKQADASGESIRTLEVYLSTGGRKARAAELLYIHLNTLKYRLATLSQKLGVDLDDPATMFSLEYALHILKYLECFGGKYG